MAQHFLLSKAAKTLSLAQVFRMTDEEAETTFRQGALARYGRRAGLPVIAAASTPTIAAARTARPASGAGRAARISRSRPGRCSPPTSCRCEPISRPSRSSATRSRASRRWQCRRDLGLSYKSAFVLLHKLREAMAAEMKGRVVGGEGKVAEVDGGYFGGYVKPANLAENRRIAASPSTSPASARRSSSSASATAIQSRPCSASEGQALNFIKSRIAKGTVVNADEAPNWNELHSRFEMKRINHEEAYSLDGACTNWAEEFFSRMRRAEIGHHHHIAGAYLLRYAQEAAWREDHRRVVEWRSGEPRCRTGDGEQAERRFLRLLAAACFSYGLSHSLSGRVIRRAEK